MRMRKRFLIVVAGLLTFAGCDDQEPIPPENLNRESATTTAATTAPAKADQLAGPFKSLPLAVIPFVADAPESWSIQSGIANRIVLHGKLSNGEVDTLLSTRAAINADAYASLVAELKRASTQSSNVTTKVITRDNLTIIERVEPFGLPGQSPAERLVSYNVKYFVQGASLEYEVYELNVTDLSQEMYDKDGDLIRKVLLGLKYDPKATEQTP